MVILVDLFKNLDYDPSVNQSTNNLSSTSDALKCSNFEWNIVFIGENDDGYVYVWISFLFPLYFPLFF